MDSWENQVLNHQFIKIGGKWGNKSRLQMGVQKLWPFKIPQQRASWSLQIYTCHNSISKSHLGPGMTDDPRPAQRKCQKPQIPIKRFNKSPFLRFFTRFEIPTAVDICWHMLTSHLATSSANHQLIQAIPRLPGAAHPELPGYVQTPPNLPLSLEPGESDQSAELTCELLLNVLLISWKSYSKTHGILGWSLFEQVSRTPLFGSLWTIYAGNICKSICVHIFHTAHVENNDKPSDFRGNGSRPRQKPSNHPNTAGIGKFGTELNRWSSMLNLGGVHVMNSTYMFLQIVPFLGFITIYDPHWPMVSYPSLTQRLQRLFTCDQG